MINKKRLSLIAGIVLTSLVIVTVFFAVKATVLGQKLVALENKAAELTEANQELGTQIVTSTSLSQIGRDAKNMGMANPTHFIYMTHDGVALRGSSQVASIGE